MTSAARRIRGTQVGLTRETVVAAAAAVAEREGFAGLSLRGVALALGVSPTAIYRHVSGKDELIDTVADAFVARALEDPLPSDPVRRVRELAHRMRRAGVEHPGLLTAVFGHVPERLPSAHVTFTEHLLSALIEAGASEETAHLLYRIITKHYVGDVVHLSNRHAPARSPLAEREHAVRDQDTLPLTSRMLATTNRGDDYERELDNILSLLTVKARAEPGAGASIAPRASRRTATKPSSPSPARL